MTDAPDPYCPCPAACAAATRTLDPGYMPENASFVAPPPCPICRNAGRVLKTSLIIDHRVGTTFTGIVPNIFDPSVG